MEQKNAIVYALINSIVYELMLKTSVYNTWVNEDTSLADLLQTIVTALNGKVTKEQLEQEVIQALDKVKESGEFDDLIESVVKKYLEENPINPGVQFETDETLILENGILSVNTTDQMEQDNTLPMTSAGVYAQVGNIEALLKTI